MVLDIEHLVKAALEEDVGEGDLTSLACLEPGPMKAVIVAKSEGTLSGLHPALVTFDRVDSANIVRPMKKDGDRFAKGDSIIELDGFNQTLLTAERTALNFLARLSGIATLTAQYVKEVAGTGCQILDTRKTAPGYRLLEKAAVLHGGGMNHRLGLYDMVLIKDNHIASTGSITAAVEATRTYLKTVDFRLQFKRRAEKIAIEVEVCTLKQLTEAIGAGVDQILLDNQSRAMLKEMVTAARKLDRQVRLEASGNVNLANVAEVAASGVDFVSIGALTHSAPSSDFSMQVIV